MGDVHFSQSLKPRCDHTGNEARCVIFVPPGIPDPKSLFDTLNHRKIRFIVVNELAQVMVKLAITDASVLVISQPDRIPRTRELLAAIQRYYPHVVCWKYAVMGHDGRVRLNRFRIKPARSLKKNIELATNRQCAKTHEVTVAEVDSGQALDRTRTVNDPSPVVSDMKDEYSQQAEASDEPLLTQEELSMLIGTPVDRSVDRENIGEGKVDPT